MRKMIGCASALALLFAVTGCSTDEPENNVIAEDVNATMNMDELPPAENAANEAVEAPTEVEDAPAPKPTPPKPAPPKPRPAEPEAPTADCPPEHREAGHC